MKLLRFFLISIFAVLSFSTLKAQLHDYEINHDLRPTLCDTVINSFWDGTSWFDKYKQVSKVDANGLVIYVRGYSDGNLMFKSDITRNTASKATLQDIWSKGQNGTYIHSTEMYYAYDKVGNMIKSTIRKVGQDDSTMDSSTRVLYNYDKSNYLITIINQNYNGTGWDNFSRYTNTNNADGLPLISFEEKWDAINSNWDSVSHNITTYDNQGKIIQAIVQKVTDSAGYKVWVDSRSVVFMYNVNNYRQVSIVKIWNVNTSNWENSMLDSTNNNSTITYLWDGAEWGYFSKLTCVGLFSGINPIRSTSKESLSIYPNPANDRISINTQGFKGTYTMVISNVVGKKVVVQTISNPESRLVVNVSHLNPGLYNVTLQNQNSIHTARIIIAR